MHILLASNASLTGYSELVRELGGDPEVLMHCAGLELSLLEEFDQMMSAEAMSRLFDLTAHQLSCPSFCLLLSQRQGLSVLGPVGLVMSQSAYFHDAYQALEKYIHLRSEAGTFSLETDGAIAIIKYVPHVHGENHSRQICDLSIGIGCSLIRSYIGKHWKPRAVYFQHSAPVELSAYSMLFQAPLSFDQEFNGLVFDAALLDAPLGSDEPELRQFLSHYLDELEDLKEANIEHQCANIIRELLPKGSCSLRLVAQRLDLKERALQRRLNKINRSYQAILDQVRQKIATEYLASKTTNLTALSQLLGYTDLSSFSKAYKCWFGVAPSQHMSSQNSDLNIQANKP
jgi:AraC-like DNA-binding protein